MRVVVKEDRDNKDPWCRECLMWYWHKDDCKTGAIPPQGVTDVRCPNCGTSVPLPETGDGQ